jgi:hypothetical protein
MPEVQHWPPGRSFGNHEGGRFVSIIRVGLAQTRKFSEGYEAIFGKPKATPAKKNAKPAKASTKKPKAGKKAKKSKKK